MSTKEAKIIRRVFFLGVLLFVLAITACTTPSPKPHAYRRMDLPTPSYQLLNPKGFPYSFLYSQYAQIVMKDGYYEINVNYPKYNSTIYLTYKSITNNFRELSKDGHEFAYSHSSKADAINESNYSNPEARVWCVLYSLDGEVASPIQFIATDSTKHWLRGAVYINSVPNQDSLAPMIKYLRADALKLIESIRWEK